MAGSNEYSGRATSVLLFWQLGHIEVAADDKGSERRSFMTTGTRLKITRATIAFDLIAGKRTMLTIPTEAILVVLPGFAAGDRMVNVLWESHAVEMFATDLAKRGTEVRSRAATAYQAQPTASRRTVSERSN